MTQYIIIGNGVAANSAAQEIRKIDADGPIKMFTRESVPYYYIPGLPEYLSGEKQSQDLIIHDQNWYANNSIDLFLNTEITAIDVKNKQVTAEDGSAHAYDKLLIATGGYSFVPPIKGADSKGVYTLRTLENADTIKEKAKQSKELVLIGGGLLGLEAGNGIRKSGVKVTVVEFFPRLLPRQMDTAGAAILKKQMENMGFTFYLDAKTSEIKPDGSGLTVTLESGNHIAADMVLISAGVRPVLQLAKDIGADIDRGVKVNDQMETGIADVYAAGDLIQHNDRFYGIWPASMEQGKAAGRNMAGKTTNYTGTVTSNTLKVVGIDLTASGNIDAENDHSAIVYQDEEKSIYRKIVVEDNKIIGTILFGNISGSDEILNAIRQKTDISAFAEDLKNPDFDFSKL